MTSTLGALSGALSARNADQSGWESRTSRLTVPSNCRAIRGLLISLLPLRSIGRQIRVLSSGGMDSSTMPAQTKPNILFIMADDIGWFNASCYNHGIMGYTTPNIDRIAKEGAMFTDFYGQQSCTAGRAAFITGQSPIRTGLTKVGLPGSEIGLQPEDPSVGDFMKSLGYATGQFGKNHLGDRNKFLPTVHGFDEVFGNLY